MLERDLDRFGAPIEVHTARAALFVHIQDNSLLALREVGEVPASQHTDTAATPKKYTRIDGAEPWTRHR